MKKITLLFLSILLFSFSLNAQKNEESKSWLLQFSNLLTGIPESRYGIETDGNFFYASCWNNDTVFKYSPTGTFVEKFKVAGLSLPAGQGFRDLAYQGNYFYGSNASGNIFKLDLANKNFIDTIICSSSLALRHLTINPDNGDFWGGDWNSLYRISSIGVILDTVDVASLGFTHISGCAFDTAGGNFLWITDQSGNGVNLSRIDLTTTQINVPVFDASADLGLSLASGGLFLFPGIVSGTVTIGGLCQRNGDDILFGYHAGTIGTMHDLSISSAVSPESSCFVAPNENLIVRIQNNGLSDEFNFNVYYQVNGAAPVFVLYTDTIHPAEEVVFQLSNSIDMTTAGMYNFTVYTSLPLDGDKTDDTLRFSAEHQVNLIPPIYQGFNGALDFQGWEVLDANLDGYTWNYVPLAGVNGTGSFEYSYNDVNDTIIADDWLFTRCIGLAQGFTYFVGISYKAFSYNHPEKFKLCYGQMPDSASMDSSILNMPNVVNTNFNDTIITMISPSTGAFFFGVKCYSNANRWKLNIDDFTITALPGFADISTFDFNVYPNPASDQIFIAASEKIDRVSIIDLMGRIIFEMKPGQKSFSLKIPQIADGQYILQCEGEKGSTVKRINILK
ncbi:MAG: T9SS type A sorting domain-containing protein [Bacteroidota bacterium]